jgi:hypothetical protein
MPVNLALMTIQSVTGSEPARRHGLNEGQGIALDEVQIFPGAGRERPDRLTTGGIRSVPADEDVHVCARVRRRGAVEMLLEVGSLGRRGRIPAAWSSSHPYPGIPAGPRRPARPGQSRPPGRGVTGVRVVHRPPNDI